MEYQPPDTREFVLLEYLMRNAGRAIGKAELLDHVWNSASDVPTSMRTGCPALFRYPARRSCRWWMLSSG